MVNPAGLASARPTESRRSLLVMRVSGMGLSCRCRGGKDGRIHDAMHPWSAAWRCSRRPASRAARDGAGRQAGRQASIALGESLSQGSLGWIGCCPLRKLHDAAAPAAGSTRASACAAGNASGAAHDAAAAGISWPDGPALRACTDCWWQCGWVARGSAAAAVSGKDGRIDRDDVRTMRPWRGAQHCYSRRRQYPMVNPAGLASRRSLLAMRVSGMGLPSRAGRCWPWGSAAAAARTVASTMPCAQVRSDLCSGASSRRPA